MHKSKVYRPSTKRQKEFLMNKGPAQTFLQRKTY